METYLENMHRNCRTVAKKVEIDINTLKPTKMSTEKKRINWWKLVLDVLKVVAGAVLGTQI